MSHLLSLRGPDEEAPSPTSSLPHTCLANPHPARQSLCLCPALRPADSHSRAWRQSELHFGWMNGACEKKNNPKKLENNPRAWLTRKTAGCRPSGCSCSDSGRGRSHRWCRCMTQVGGWSWCPLCRWGCGSRWRGRQRRVRLTEGWHYLEQRQKTVVFYLVAQCLKHSVDVLMDLQN